MYIVLLLIMSSAPVQSSSSLPNLFYGGMSTFGRYLGVGTKAPPPRVEQNGRDGAHFPTIEEIDDVDAMDAPMDAEHLANFWKERVKSAEMLISSRKYDFDSVEEAKRDVKDLYQQYKKNHHAIVRAYRRRQWFQEESQKLDSGITSMMRTCKEHLMQTEHKQALYPHIYNNARSCPKISNSVHAEH